MQKFSYVRHLFPPFIIQHSIWLYFKFSLSYRDVEDLLAERGIDVSCETIRRWVLKFGSKYAGKLTRYRPPIGQWHLDEVFVTINNHICVGLLMMKGKFWKFWFNRVETSGLPSN